MENRHDNRLGAVFKALGDETRLCILEELRHRDHQSLFEICARLAHVCGRALSRQAVTRHLDTLEKAGLIRVTWKGRTKVHSLKASVLGELVLPWVAPFLQENDT